MDEAKSESRRIWMDAGLRTLYSRLIELGAFQEVGVPHIHSVKRADAEEAFALISVQNSLRK